MTGLMGAEPEDLRVRDDDGRGEQEAQQAQAVVPPREELGHRPARPAKTGRTGTTVWHDAPPERFPEGARSSGQIKGPFSLCGERAACQRTSRVPGARRATGDAAAA
ncbi:hypothetical protein GCM10010371_07480 [Streptomyces subrutilus]|uniref:Uncharacterized protein n=1 Tax=Streptomyces subrutilus TaxID=36818 RepID=A0A918UZU0_9ACTN|nr:hypothetical protein GCM10010371_07480 [Streptomyces subrutilus]